MRILKYILFILIVSSCGDIETPIQDTEITITSGSLTKSTYCLLDLMEGDPTDGGCWTVISDPSNSIVIGATDDNPCIVFDNLPCGGDYVFEYSATCGGCEYCIPHATLTICLTCGCPFTFMITATCN